MFVHVIPASAHKVIKVIKTHRDDCIAAQSKPDKTQTQHVLSNLSVNQNFSQFFQSEFYYILETFQNKIGNK